MLTDNKGNRSSRLTIQIEQKKKGYNNKERVILVILNWVMNKEIACGRGKSKHIFHRISTVRGDCIQNM